MTQEEQISIVGRLALEHREASHDMVLLSAQLDRAADTFYKLAIALRQPTLVRFDGEAIPAGIRVPEGMEKKAEFAFASASIDGRKLKELVSELRAATLKHQQLAQHMKELGL